MTKPDAFRGMLTPAQVADEINAANENAKRLTEDAAALLDQGRHPSAASLAILAIEEAGKVSILRGLALASSATEARSAWKDYRAHTKKNVAWILPLLAAKGAQKLDDFRPSYELSASLVQIARVFMQDHTCTEREIELWIDHIGPVWRQDYSLMQQASINWYAALQAVGLRPEGKNDMEQLIHHGIPIRQAESEPGG